MTNKLRPSLCLGLAIGLMLAPRTPTILRGADQQRELILLIEVDTLRRDSLGVYGGSRSLTPYIDRLARENGVIFDTAYAASNSTYPSVTSLMTGKYPTRHGFWGPFIRASDLRPNIATVMPSGFTKLLANANPNTLDVYRRDFDEIWSEYPTKGSEHYDSGYFPAEYVFDRTREMVERHHRPAQLLLYVQVADPHAPYYPLRRYADLFKDDPLAEKISGKYQTYMGGLVWDDQLTKRPAAEIQNARNRYDAEVRYLDEEIGKFIDYVTPLYQKRLIMFSSDHGESFLDHQDAEHGKSLFDELIRIPLFIVDTEQRFGTPRRVWAPISNVDVLSTLARLVGSTIKTSADGVPIQSTLARFDKVFPLVKRRSIVSEVVQTSTMVDFSHIRPDAPNSGLLYFKDHPINVLIRATIEGSDMGVFGRRVYKYVRNESRDRTEMLLRFPDMFFHPHYSELYRLDKDPTERKSDMDVALATRMLDGSPLKGIFPNVTPAGGSFTPDQMERLRSLGYIR